MRFALLPLVLVLLANCELKETYFPDCSVPVTESPSTYPKGSELYYLAWVEHGTFGPKGESARRLLLMESKSELEKAENIYRCQDRQVVKNMMALEALELLGMFDGLPDVDLSNPPKRAEKYPYEQINDPFWNEQLGILKRWFEENEKRIIWDASARRYRVKV